MTNYYNKEDDLPNTPGHELENVTATRLSFANALPETAENLNRVAELTGWLYDQQPSKEAMDAVREVYEIGNHLGTRIAHYDLAHEAAVTLVKRLFKETRKLAYKVQEFSDEAAALEADNQSLEHDLKKAMVSSYEVLLNGIAEMSGCADWAALHRLLDIFVGNIEPTHEQCELLLALIATCVEIEDEEAQAS